MIQQSRPAVPVTLRSSPIPPGRGRMVPSCYTKSSRRGDLSQSHYHGPRLQYKEQSNYSTAQGLACRQLIPHTRMYEYTSLRAPILGSGRRLMCRINNRYPTSLLFGPVGKPPWHYHPHVATPLSQWHFESSHSPKERWLNKECKQYHLVIQPCHIMCKLDPAISD